MSSASSSGASSRSERIACRARRSPTKRGRRRFAAPGMIPSLRAGSVQRVPCSARMWSTTSSSWQPPPIANVSAAAIQSFSVSRPAEAAVDLVDEAEIPDREEQVGDLAAVEVGEVQAGAEDAPIRVARVVDRSAPQDRDLDLRVEEDEVDRGFQRAGRRVVLGVEVARVSELDRADVAASGDGGGAEVGVPGALVVGLVIERSLRRAQHHVDQVPARVRVGEDVAEQLALRDLVALFVLLEALALALDHVAGGCEAGHELGRLVHEIVGSQAVLAGVGEAGVERVDVAGEEGVPEAVRIAGETVQPFAQAGGVAVEVAIEQLSHRSYLPSVARPGRSGSARSTRRSRSPTATRPRAASAGPSAGCARPRRVRRRPGPDRRTCRGA